MRNPPFIVWFDDRNIHIYISTVKGNGINKRYFLPELTGIEFYAIFLQKEVQYGKRRRRMYT